MSTKRDKKAAGQNWEQEAKQNLANWQRAQAELENLKKRSTKEREQYLQFATKELILDLLPILDNFERAIEHAPQDEQKSNWLTGITYIEQQLTETLKNHGVEKREVKVGDVFDENFHHAVGSEINDDVKENHIIKVINPAYVMAGEVIRPASVIVVGKENN